MRFTDGRHLTDDGKCIAAGAQPRSARGARDMCVAHFGNFSYGISLRTMVQAYHDADMHVTEFPEEEIEEEP